MNLLLPWRWKRRFSAVLDEKLQSSREAVIQQISQRFTAQEAVIQQISQQFTAQQAVIQQISQEISRLRVETYYLRQALLKNEKAVPDLSTQPLPINFQPRDPAAIDEDVRLALEYRDSWDNWMRRKGINPAKLSGLTILEIGPGFNFGLALILAGRGARMIVADRYLAPWDADYHPEFYRRLRARLECDTAALDAVIEANDYPTDVLTLVANRAEELAAVASDSIDVVISNATLEHINDIRAAARALARVTKSGGLGIHHADYRDHRNFDRPLEFLLVETATLEPEYPQAMGNRLRPSEIARYFSVAGFKTEITPWLEADVAYLEEFIPRLRASRSHYREWAADELKVLGATLSVRKTEVSTASTEVRL